MVGWFSVKGLVVGAESLGHARYPGKHLAIDLLFHIYLHLFPRVLTCMAWWMLDLCYNIVWCPNGLSFQRTSSQYICNPPFASSCYYGKTIVAFDIFWFHTVFPAVNDPS